MIRAASYETCALLCGHLSHWPLTLLELYELQACDSETQELVAEDRKCVRTFHLNTYDDDILSRVLDFWPSLRVA